jgi:three-Cys-motif partner protein
MRTDPKFTKLVFWELEPHATILREDLTIEFPDDSRFSVVSGDCNTYLKQGLDLVADLRWAPTFAFIDPYGLEVAWETLETLATWRKESNNRKVEMWILFPESGITRVLGLKGVRGESGAKTLNRLFGTDDWIAIHQRRQSGEFDPETTRAEFINLLRWRLENVLGYATTHALTLGNVSGIPVYTMIFATDAKPGDKIMSDIYRHASVHEIPSLRARALAAREARRLEARGTPTLFDPPPPMIESTTYEHTSPWAPPEKQDQSVELADEPTAIELVQTEDVWPAPDEDE